MSAAALACAPAPVALRHQVLDYPDRWRCIVHGRGFGIVTGFLAMASTVTTYDVALDSGDSVRVWPSAVRRPGPQS